MGTEIQGKSYRAKVTAIEASDTKDGIPQLEIRFQTENGPVIEHLFFSEALEKFSHSRLKKAFSFRPGKDSFNSLIGRHCLVVILNENASKKHPVKFGWFKPLPSVASVKEKHAPSNREGLATAMVDKLELMILKKEPREKIEQQFAAVEAYLNV